MLMQLSSQLRSPSGMTSSAMSSCRHPALLSKASPAFLARMVVYGLARCQLGAGPPNPKPQTPPFLISVGPRLAELRLRVWGFHANRVFSRG